jgi:hypothetical protein
MHVSKRMTAGKRMSNCSSLFPYRLRHLEIYTRILYYSSAGFRPSNLVHLWLRHLRWNPAPFTSYTLLSDHPWPSLTGGLLFDILSLLKII